MRIRTLALILLTIFGLYFGSNQVLAVDIPNFPSCSNPQGTIKVQYGDGIHGIVGDGTGHTGSDIVYQLDNGNLTQCFCSTDGQGIQTNWWKDSSLSKEQHQLLINSGWTLIPNGALWGLEETAYFAQNSSFSCLPGTTGGGGGNGGTGGGDGLGCATHDCSNQGGVLGASTGQVLGTSTGEVLGLASTGGAFLPYILALLGLGALSFGVVLNIKSSRK